MALFKDYLITLAGRVASALAAFISLPILLQYLGPSEYSLIAFASLVQGYANILDAGLSPALASNVAKHGANREQALHIISASTRASLLKFSKYSLPLFIPLITTAYVTLPHVAFERLAVLCVILLMDASVSALFRLQYSALQGFGNHAVANSIHTLNIAARTSAAVAIVVLGHRLELIYVTQALITCAAILMCFRYYRVRRSVVSEPILLHVGNTEGTTTKDLTMIAIGLAIINSIPLVVLGRIGGSSELTHFFLATSLGGIVATLQGSLISVMIPSLSRQLAQAPLDNQHRDFRRMSRNVVSVSFALGGLAFCLAEPIVSLWVRKTGVDRALLTTLFRFQLVSAAFVSLTLVPYALSIPMRRTRIQLVAVGIYMLGCCIAMPLARYHGSIESFGLITMLAGVCFSTGYFLASTELIYPKPRPAGIWAAVAAPVPLIALTLIAACTVGSIFSSAQDIPSWLISSGIYTTLASGIVLFAFQKSNKEDLCA